MKHLPTLLGENNGQLGGENTSRWWKQKLLAAIPPGQPPGKLYPQADKLIRKKLRMEERWFRSVAYEITQPGSGFQVKCAVEGRQNETNRWRTNPGKPPLEYNRHHLQRI